MFTALLTIVVTLVFAGTFHAASQQIAVDKLTVKTALALAGLELLNFTLSLLIGFVVGLIVCWGRSLHTIEARRSYERASSILRNIFSSRPILLTVSKKDAWNTKGQAYQIIVTTVR